MDLTARCQRPDETAPQRSDALGIAEPAFADAVRCALQTDDLTGRQAKLIGDEVAALGSPWLRVLHFKIEGARLSLLLLGD